MCDGSLAAQTEGCPQGWVARGKWQTVQPNSDTWFAIRKGKRAYADGVPLPRRQDKLSVFIISLSNRVASWGSVFPGVSAGRDAPQQTLFWEPATLLCAHSVIRHGHDT